MNREAKLEKYKTLLLSWTAKVNLIGPEVRRNLESHVAEALAGAEFLSPEGEVLDFGSGGGLPGIPMAIAAEGKARFHLVEADIRKWSFLKFACRECELNCLVHGDRLDQVIRRLPPELQFDLVTSRAVGHPSAWLPQLRGRLSPAGRIALFQSSTDIPELDGFTAGPVHRLSRGTANFIVTLNAVPRGTQ